jgi:hypothetical protein
MAHLVILEILQHSIASRLEILLHFVGYLATQVFQEMRPLLLLLEKLLCLEI